MIKKKKTILKLLKDNARMSLSDISAIVDLSEEQVDSMIKELEEDGSILKYTCISKDREEDELIRAIIELSVRPEKKSGYDAIAEKITHNKYVIDHYLLSGSYDFLIIVEAKNLNEISSIISDLASMPGVINTSTHFTLKKYKQMGIPLTTSHAKSRLAVMP